MTQSSPRSLRDRYVDITPVVVPIYAILLAMVLGAIVILLAGGNPITAYAALIRGAVGTPDRFASALARSTPFIGAALAVVFAFRAGLFNIGAEGQLLVGALMAAWVGTWSGLAGLPSLIGVPLMLGAGLVGGGLWGWIPGKLKAKTGAHEVITTIMLNAIALRITEWLVSSRQPRILLDPAASVPRTAPIADGFRIFGFGETKLHGGFVLAFILVVVVWYVLERTTTGFEVSAVGLNRHAAHYAGIGVGSVTVLAMVVSGALAGAAGAAEVSGGTGFLSPEVFAGVGFDAIAIALLARANPFGVIPAAMLWGFLLAGAPLMQLESGLSIDIVLIVQALIVLFIAADVIVRKVFRVPAGGGSLRRFASGWGS